MFIPSTRGLGLPRFSFPPPRSPGSPWALWCSKDGPGPLSWVCCWPAFPIQVGAEVDPLSGADPGPWGGGQACSFITTPPVFLGLKWNFWSFLISRLSTLFLIRNHLLSSGCTQIARYAGSQQTLKVRQNSRGHPGRVSPKHRPSGISDQQVPTIPWRSKKQGGEPTPSPLVKPFRTVSRPSLCRMMRGVYISSSCDQRPLLGTGEDLRLGRLSRDASATPLAGPQQEQETAEQALVPRGTWHKGGRAPVSLHPLILREVDSEQAYMCNRGGKDVTASSERGAELAPKTWEHSLGTGTMQL